jgi:hypothetical protein
MCLILLSGAAHWLHAQTVPAPTPITGNFKTVYGHEYKDATVSRVEPDGVVLRTKSGISKVYFVELPKEVQARFHYDAAKATQSATVEQAAIAQFNAAAQAATVQRQQQAQERQRQTGSATKQQQEQEAAAEQQAAQAQAPVYEGIGAPQPDDPNIKPVYTGVGAPPDQPLIPVEAKNQTLDMHQKYAEPAEQQQLQVEIPQALQAVQAIQTEQTRQAELSPRQTVIIMGHGRNPATAWGGTQTQETQKRDTQTLETQKRETQTLETQAQLPR